MVELFEGQNGDLKRSKGVDEARGFKGLPQAEIDQSSGLLSISDSPELSSKKGVFRGKTSLRLKYEAEVTFIRKKFGTLEDIRNLLGLSQRKICQLLLVDPSAWNRWTKSGESAPPHIYRALEWYLHLQEKNPTLDQRFWLSQITHPTKTAPDPRLEQAFQQVQKLEAEVNLLKSGIFSASNRVAAQMVVRPQAGKRPTFIIALAAAGMLGFVIAWLILK